jgi:hypothetical protein
MEYRVVPFVADVSVTEGTAAAAQQLQDLINQMAQEGWSFVRLENVETLVRDPGSKGCFGLGAVPPAQTVTRFDMAVFQKK